MGYGGEKRCLRYITLLLVIFCSLVIIYSPKYIPPKQVPGWELNVTREVGVYIVPGNETSLISGRGICKDRVSLVIVVCSAPSHFIQRMAIRHTWGSHNLSTVRVAFLLGRPTNYSLQAGIDDESIEFGDVIQENFMDTYNNLTLKSLMMLKWVLRRCNSADFLMKTDDDMYINVTRIASLLVNQTRPSKLLIGSLICRAKPILDFNSKWYNPKYMYNGNVYPPYLSGTGYVMSRDVARILFHTALSTKLIHLEDVFLTGICAAKAGIKPRNHGSFTYQHVRNMCDPLLATNHRLSPEELEAMWRESPNCTAPTQKTTFINPCH